MKLFLCGDVMTGRGVDQILPTPADPRLYERYCRSALNYVALAEQRSGPIPRPVGFDYVWGDLLDDLERRAPNLRIINLETSVTADGTPEAKGVNYRMHPANLRCLNAAQIDCCVLANNHVFDWGATGLTDTLESLHSAGIKTTGAGATLAEAAAPAVLEVPGGRLLVFAYGMPSSGVPALWDAARTLPGVNYLPDLSDESCRRIADDIGRRAEPGDAVILSIHWGRNWGYHVPEPHQRFARRLIEEAGVHVVHGHSSHHPLGIEVHDGQPVLFGCGDLLNDYEGIGGYEDFRSELVLAYFLELSGGDHKLHSLEMVPFRLHKFRLIRSSTNDLAWLGERMNRECRAFGHQVNVTSDRHLRLSWRDHE
jgi:poly-gamma-glutamate synthesis protein (capsule biosynthesis protein)